MNERYSYLHHHRHHKMISIDTFPRIIPMITTMTMITLMDGMILHMTMTLMIMMIIIVMVIIVSHKRSK